MGNHHGHGSHSKSGESTPTSQGSRKSVSRASSNTLPSEAPVETPSPLLPVEKLAKILSDKSYEEEHVHGITLPVFSKYLFPRYPILAEKLFDYLHQASKCKNSYLDTQSFKQQSEKYLAILDDEIVRDTFVKMFSSHSDSSSDTINPEGLRSLLMCAYHVSMDHYSEGPQMCLSISKTLKAVVDSCFHTKNQLSSQFVSHWLAANAPRLLLPLHRYIVHSLATSYRTLEESDSTLAAGLELATPVLEQPPPFALKHPHLLHMSMSWLLAGALPPVYSRPQKANSPSNSGVGLASTNFLTKLLCSVPSHWVNLYDSDENGLGANRFLHHVLNYKGPTLVLLKVENGQLFCIASPNEWRESNHYWGGEDAAAIQLLPKFLVLEKGSKMLYLNTTVRGYPYGLRAGKDPRNPVIIIDGGFEKMEFKKIPYSLLRIEVWGCGDAVSRENQLEVKKWEVKEAERQRCVKLSADDWLDHPDRYLLELAEARNIKRWVAPTLKVLYRRRLKAGPEEPQPRSTFLEWNYEAEVFAFGKRLGEEFDRKMLKQALTHRSYVVSEQDKAKEKGIEFEGIASNQKMVEEGDKIISNYLKEELSKKHPPDVVKALHDHLTTVDMLAHVASHMGLKDIVLTSEFPVENSTLAKTFKAVVAALKSSQDLARAHLFIKDFLLCQLVGKEVSDIWSPENPLDYLSNLLKEKGITEIEPRLCNQSATNTILANYQVGLYNNKQLLGIGWGESVQIAKESAALDAIYRIQTNK